MPSRLLDMVFLATMGIIMDVYCYSVGVILYITVGRRSGWPRLVPLFESSLLLITFVLIEKYLKGRDSDLPYHISPSDECHVAMQRWWALWIEQKRCA
jgi:hypothetical protein